MSPVNDLASRKEVLMPQTCGQDLFPLVTTPAISVVIQLSSSRGCPVPSLDAIASPTGTPEWGEPHLYGPLVKSRLAIVTDFVHLLGLGPKALSPRTSLGLVTVE